MFYRRQITTQKERLIANKGLMAVEQNHILSPNTPYLGVLFGQIKNFTKYRTSPLLFLEEVLTYSPATIIDKETRIGTRMQELIHQMIAVHGKPARKEDTAEIYIKDNSTLSQLRNTFFGCCTQPWKHELDDNRLERAKRIAELTIRERVGSCEMQCNVAYWSLTQQFHDTNIELVSMSQYDHCLVLIGRNPQTDIVNVADWNEEAYVCDPYNHTCYPGNELPHFIDAFVKCRAIHPVVERPRSYGCLLIDSHFPRESHLNCVTSHPSTTS